MYELLASPHLDGFIVLRPGNPDGFKIQPARYRELQQASRIPDWLAAAAHCAWNLRLHDQPVQGRLLVREQTPYGYARASYEPSFGCNYDCQHCYLGPKRHGGLGLSDREKALVAIRDSGVLWLQLTGGEPTIDPLFPDIYTAARELGMAIMISTNGSRLHHPRILELLTTARPHRITVSIYGATDASYDALTRSRGAFRRFQKGLRAACEARLPVALSMIITRHNAHEIPQMRGLAERLGIPIRGEYPNLTPTVSGGPGPLTSQDPRQRRERQPYTGCNAGRTFYHVHPDGRASICKIAREPAIPFLQDGPAALAGLYPIAQRLLSRDGPCSSCQLKAACGSCPPLARQYRLAGAPLAAYCQRPDTAKEVNT